MQVGLRRTLVRILGEVVVIRRSLLVGLTILVCGGPLGAQTTLEYPGGKQPSSVPQGLAEHSGQMLRCLIHTQSAKISSRPSPSAEAVGTADFLDDFYVAGKGPNDGYVFVVTVASEVNFPDLPIRECHGWVRRQDCLVFSVGIAGQGPECMVDPNTSIHHKAMLVNRLEQNEGVESLSERVAFLDKPQSSGESRGERALFTIFYVYAEARDYLLLGLEPRLRDIVLDKECILGWVPKHRACRWNTREAVEFNKSDLVAGLRNQPCRIFLHDDEVKAFLKVKDESVVAPIAMEDIRVKEWEFDQARFPLIDAPNGPSVISTRGNRLYRIGFIGDVFDTSGATGTVQPIATRRQVEELREKVRLLQARTSKIQICFLIDATFSMDPWITAAAEAVTGIVRQLQDRYRGGEHLEVSVNYYRDEDDPKPVEFHPFQRPSEALFLLDPGKAVGGGSPHEAMFSAICQRLSMEDERDSEGRVNKYSFDPEAVKILILIGDDGNDPADTEHTMDQVFQQIRRTGGSSSLGFLALSVGKPGTSRDTFIDQTRAIAEKLAKAEQAGYPILQTSAEDEPIVGLDSLRDSLQNLTGQVLISDNAEEIVEAISRRFDVGLAEKELYQKCLTSLHAGNEIPDSTASFMKWAGISVRVGDSSSVRAYGVIWKHRMEEMIQRHELDRLKLAARGVQLFHEGWVAEYDPRETPNAKGSIPPAIRHVVLMHKSEVNDLATVLGMVTRRWEPRALRMAWEEALDKVTGKDVSVSLQVSPFELMKKHFGIKVKKGLLALSLEELSRQSAGSLLSARSAMEESYYRLKHAYDGQEADYYWANVGGTGRKVFKFRNLRPRSYWWYTDGAEDVFKEGRAWIDRDMLP